MNPGEIDFSFRSGKTIDGGESESVSDRKRRKYHASDNVEFPMPISQTGQLIQQERSNMENPDPAGDRRHPVIRGRASGMMMMGPPPPLGNPSLAFVRDNQSSYQHQRQRQLPATASQQNISGDVTTLQLQLLQLQHQANFFGGFNSAPLDASVGKSMLRDESSDGAPPLIPYSPAPTGSSGEQCQEQGRILSGLSQQQTQQQQQQLLSLQAQQQTLLLQSTKQSSFMSFQPHMNSQSGFPPLQQPQQRFLTGGYNPIDATNVSLPTSNALIDPNILGSGDSTSLQDEKAQHLFDNDTGTGLFGNGGASQTQQHDEKMKNDDNILTGRRPMLLFMPCDEESLSEYQCLVRRQIEMFEAGHSEVESNAKGRNKPIVPGQVGIRCRHCSQVTPKQRTKGAMYYPAKLAGLYQAAQSLATSHLCIHCKHIPPPIRQELLTLKEKKSSAGGGKDYWGEGVRILGVFEDKHGLRFQSTKKAPA